MLEWQEEKLPMSYFSRPDGREAWRSMFLCGMRPGDEGYGGRTENDKGDLKGGRKK